MQVPELMNRTEYTDAMTELDATAGLESAGSLQRTSDIHAAHLHYVREAVARCKDLHIDNWSDYRAYIPGLARYTFNGNLAVLDSTKGTAFDKAAAYRAAVQSSEDLERLSQQRRRERQARAADEAESTHGITE